MNWYISKLKSVYTADCKKAQIIRYIITGGIATALQLIFYIISVQVFELSAETSVVFSYGMSLCCNFILSNYFTFHTKPNKRKAVSFILSHSVNLGMQTLFVNVFKAFVGESYALIPAMMLCIPINFLLVRFSLTNRRFQSA